MIKFYIQHDQREILFHFCKENFDKENLKKIIKSIFQVEEIFDIFDRNRLKYSKVFLNSFFQKTI